MCLGLPQKSAITFVCEHRVNCFWLKKVFHVYSLILLHIFIFKLFCSFCKVHVILLFHHFTINSWAGYAYSYINERKDKQWRKCRCASPFRPHTWRPTELCVRQWQCIWLRAWICPHKMMDPPLSSCYVEQCRGSHCWWCAAKCNMQRHNLILWCWLSAHYCQRAYYCFQAFRQLCVNGNIWISSRCCSFIIA